MKRYVILFVFILITLPLFAQAPASAPDIFRAAQGALAQLAHLLDKPEMVSNAVAEPLGRNWFRLETDAHVFTDQVSVRQVAAVLLDIEHYNKIFDGKRSKLTASNINHSANEITANFVSIAIAGPFQLRTPYRAATRTITSTSTTFGLEMRQLAQDSETNREIKNMYAARYIEEVTINGKRYTYIRMYSIVDVNASILPGAKGVLERNSGPTNEEAIQMIITAAKLK